MRIHCVWEGGRTLMMPQGSRKAATPSAARDADRGMVLV